MSSASSERKFQTNLVKMQNNALIQVQKLQNEATEKSFQFNSAEAQKNREWEERMSNTSHQREVADLKAAGLNPALSVNNGAMSYTSASASDHADSAAPSASNILGTTMNAITNYHANKYSADRALKSAKIQANAMKESAKYSAAAQQYAADRNYAANKYAWDKKQEMQKYEYKNKPASNGWQTLDKYLQRYGVSGAAEKRIKGFFKDVKDNKIFKGKIIALNNFNLTSYGKSKVNTSLGLMGVPATKQNQQLFVKAFYFGSQVAQTALYKRRRQERLIRR